MAYRRRQGITRASTFNDEIYHQTPDHDYGDLKGHSNNGSSFRSSQSFSSHSSLAAQAIRASSSLNPNANPQVRGFTAYEDATKNESRGFWGILAQKAKSILEDEEEEQQGRQNVVVSEPPSSNNNNNNNNNNPTIRKSIDKITTSLNQIGDSFEKAFEEGRTMVASQIRRKGSDLMDIPENNHNNQSSGSNSPWQPLTQPNPHESQLKASRDVAMATAAKAKLLLRELKTVKADLAFAKQRCSQLEEENKRLRDNREKGTNNPADDDLIRLQLETLLAEKARLAHENSIYARENRFLREIVEYHQLTMQDLVYIDEGIEEVAEVNPSLTRTLSMASFAASELPVNSSPSPSSSPDSSSRLSVSTDVYYPVLVQQSSASDVGGDESPRPVRPPSLGYKDDVIKRPSSQMSV
ncbi:Uncharacterized protein Rs2_02418 [Raphanus sativus]|uniref:Uncharacterized protein LOC108857137 n=1 Tax=Raphanus sativus TaxID=3726 RepID=A0A6J0NS94_RAPSA|nr:uncharacterized protein LOC108857137 [Raphanus sativus]KAJ4916868.1 Uncharacterized protein Rs2_02418 [Raphanus sativus]